MEQFPIAFLLFAIALIIARPLIVLLHELGHAIPYILLTKQKAAVFIGSYGDEQASIKLKIGLLELYLKRNPLDWKSGLCVTSKEGVSVNKQIVYTFTGPASSFLIASVGACFVFYYNMPSLIKMVSVLLFLSAIADLFVNLIPKSHPVKIDNGGFVFNDGYMIARLFTEKKFSRENKAA